MSIHDNIVKENKQFILLNPNWFYEHKFTPIISYLKNEIFQKECKEYVDDDGNNLLHYFFMNCDVFCKMSFLLFNWCIKIGIDIDLKNKSNMTPFYYYMNFIFENNLDENTGFSDYFLDIVSYVNLTDNNIHSNGNNFLHILCHIPSILKHEKIIKNIIDTFPKVCNYRNKEKQLPLHLALSYWRKKDNKKLLFYLFLKTNPSNFILSDHKGRNIFHLVCEYNLIELVKFIYDRLQKLHKQLIIPIQNSMNTPITFIVVANKNKDLIDFLLEKDADLFIQKDSNNITILDHLFQFYALEKNQEYKTIFAKLIKNEKIIKHLSYAYIRKMYEKIKLYDIHGNYECKICFETDDIRNWRNPYVCHMHPNEKFHLECFDKCRKIKENDSICPMCDYK